MSATDDKTTWTPQDLNKLAELAAATAAQLPTPELNLAAAIGVQFEPFPAAAISNAGALASGTVEGVLVGVTPGATLTGIKLRNKTAAAGTSPTTARGGIADVTGKMLAITGNVNAATNWAAGVVPLAFTSPYTIPAGVTAVYAVIIVNGSWGTTQPVPVFNGASGASAFAADGSFPSPTIVWSGQTDLPAVGSSLTITSPSASAFYIALY